VLPLTTSGAHQAVLFETPAFGIRIADGLRHELGLAAR
jgi:hypothetical protein